MNDPQPPAQPTPRPARLSRRQFVAGTGAAAFAFTTLRPALVKGTDANTKINLGLIGCGGRGQWIANLFRNHGGYNLVAVADYFPDPANQAGEKFDVPADRRFTGLNGYKRLLEQPLDAVVIETPPYFHPQQAAAAVEAGKHVFLPRGGGCARVSGHRGRRTRDGPAVVFSRDFHAHACGLSGSGSKGAERHDWPLVSAEANYLCGLTWGKMDELLRLTRKIRRCACALGVWIGSAGM